MLKFSSHVVVSFDVLERLVKKRIRVCKTSADLIDVKISIKLFAECLEYAKYVYVNESSPVLSATAQSHTVSKCGIVETPLIVGGQRVNENEFPHMVNPGC